MWTKADALPVPAVDQDLLQHLVRSGSTPQKIALRARILLGAAEGKSNNQLSAELNVSRPTILLWRQRYLDAGLAAVLKDAPRPGRKPVIAPAKVDAIVNATLHTTPKDATHWSVRSMAKAQGVSSAMVHRIWRTHRLQPHRAESFKLSRDPHFARKVRDVVGLYLNPPDKALVLCVDEKSQIQALNRTQPELPMKKGRMGIMTHDYERHGTTAPFAIILHSGGSMSTRSGLSLDPRRVRIIGTAHLPWRHRPSPVDMERRPVIEHREPDLVEAVPQARDTRREGKVRMREGPHA